MIWYDYDDTEKVVQDGNIITKPDSHDKIIYSVHAYFDLGNAYYAFKVNVNNILESDD